MTEKYLPVSHWLPLAFLTMIKNRFRFKKRLLKNCVKILDRRLKHRSHHFHLLINKSQVIHRAMTKIF